MKSGSLFNFIVKFPNRQPICYPVYMLILNNQTLDWFWLLLKQFKHICDLKVIANY